MTEQSEEKTIEEGSFIVGDLVVIMSPDGRFHYGEISEISEDSDHFRICHHSCDEHQAQFKLEFQALGTASKYDSKKEESQD